MKDQKLFPEEIIEQSVENYFAKHHHTGNTIYFITVFAILIALSVLPFIKVDISTQSRGMIRSKQENNQIVSGVNGEIAYVHLKNNQYVHKGDTLVKVKTSRIDEQIELNRQKMETNTLFIADLQKLLYGGTIFNTGKYLSEYQLYRQKNNELEIKVNQLKKEFEINKKLFENKAIALMEYEQIKNK